MRVDHRALPCQMLLDLPKGLVNQRADVAGLVGRGFVAQDDLVLLDDGAGRVKRKGVGLRVKQLALALEGDVNLDTLAPHHDRAAPVINPSHGVMPYIHLRILIVGIPLVAQQCYRRDSVPLNHVALQVFRRGVEQPIHVQPLDLLLQPLPGRPYGVVEIVGGEQQALVLVDGAEHVPLPFSDQMVVVLR